MCLEHLEQVAVEDGDVVGAFKEVGHGDVFVPFVGPRGFFAAQGVEGDGTEGEGRQFEAHDACLGVERFVEGGGEIEGRAELGGIYLFYGVIMGIGLGTGYLSPVKTLMLWFEDRKGLATGLAVAGFGAAKAIGAPIMEAMQNNASIGVVKMFYILAVVYFIMMFVGHLLLKKPAGLDFIF